MKKRISALLLSVVLCLGMLSTTAFAAGGTVRASGDENSKEITFTGGDGQTLCALWKGGELLLLFYPNGTQKIEVDAALKNDGDYQFALEGGALTDVTVNKKTVPPQHTHAFSTAWTSDVTGHWHAATCGHDVTTGFAPHRSDGGEVTSQPTSTTEGLKVYTCTVCGYVIRKEVLPAAGGGSSSGGSSEGGRPSGGGGTANGSGVMSVHIGSMNHGRVTANPSNAPRGVKVTLTVRPNAGYTLDRLTVTDAKGNEVALNKETERRYTFIMPDTRVTVNADFSGGGDAAPSLPASGFYDVPDGYWAAGEIAWASANGVMNGVGGGMFNPGAQVNRQQTWMVLGRLAGAAPADMAAARAWAMAGGVSDGSNPTNPLSRQQLVALLYRFAQLKGIAVSGAADLSAYPDQGAVANYAREAMAWAVGSGVIAGTSDGRLNPEGTASRAQFAVIMCRFSQKTAG